jgi:hypothetical protein
MPLSTQSTFRISSAPRLCGALVCASISALELQALPRDVPDWVIERWKTAETYDLDGDGSGELVITFYPYAGGGNFITSLDITAFRWIPAAEQFGLIVVAPLSGGLEQELLEQLNTAVELAQDGLWKNARALVEGLPAKHLQDQQAILTANLIRLNEQKRFERIQIARTDPRVNAGPREIFFVSLDDGDYDGALDVLRAYETARLFSAEDGFLDSWHATRLVEYTSKALRARPELAAAHYVRAIGLALSGADPSEVTESLQRAVELAPAEPLFQQGLAYWEGQTP